MPGIRSTRSVLFVLTLLGLSHPATAQYIPFTSGPIPLCDTSTFTAQVSGVGYLSAPWMMMGNFIAGLTINITSDHPQTLQVTLTSPQGTDLLLTEFNGAGGQNYTNTTFGYDGYPSITTGTAPFTGTWNAQGGPMSVFDNEYADGTWTITVIDTACANGGTGPGGTWTPGWFDGSTGGGGFAFAFNGPPPCWGSIPGNTSYICPGGTVDILGYYEGMGMGYSYYISDQFWSPVPDPYNVSTPGIYNVEASDPWGGCMYWANYEVVLASEASLGPDQVVDLCSGAPPVDLTALFALSPGGSPAWSMNGAYINTALAAAATEPGVYQLIDQNPGGCNDTALVTLNVTNGVVLGPDQSVSICAGGSADLTMLYGTLGLSANWTFNGSAFLTPASASDAGVYSLVATNGNGCTDAADVTLVVETPPALGADQSIDLCDNSSLDLTTLYATAGLTTEWTDAGAPVANPGSVGNAGTYQLVASNAGGCSDQALVTVNLIASPALGADAAAAVCEGDVVDLNGYFTTTGLSTVWTLNGSAVPDPGSVSIAGSYALTATNGAGCSDDAQVVVTVSPNPVPGADQGITTCAGTAVDLNSLYAPQPNTAISWALDGTPVADPTSVVDGGTYTLTVTSLAGCSATAAVTLDLLPAPALGDDQSASICASSSFDLTPTYSTSGLTAAWTLNGSAVADPTGVSVTGDYQLTVTNSSGCSDVAVVSLLVNPDPSLGTDLAFSLCPWQTVDLGAVFPVAGMTATYTSNGLPVADPTAVADSGSYVVNVTDANGCTDEAIAYVTNMECLCVADFTADAHCIQDPAKFTLLADSAVVDAYWDFHGAGTNSSDVDPLVLLTTEGEVRVSLRASLSCGIVDVERTIHVDDCSDSCTVWIPSAFTPDNDGKNDSWTWYGACHPEDFSMRVFNRFGEVVFASEDPLTVWDGTYHGTQSPPGVYVYRVGYRLPYQKRKDVKGEVTLVR